MPRIVTPEAEALLDREFRVLDKGFVRLVDYLGGDSRIVAAARVSYGAGTKTVREDRALIQYLMRHGHTSPFEQVVLTLHAKMPIFVARQWVRHRTARLNEISGRYSVMHDEFYVPHSDQLRHQSERNKQGRGDTTLPPDMQARIQSMLVKDQTTAYEHYIDMLDHGLARELARINLPLSLYTQWYWQIDLHNLFHFLSLRLDPHAQYEIRAYAEVIATIAKAVAPLAYEAFEEHVLHRLVLSRSSRDRLRHLLASMDQTSEAVQEAQALLNPSSTT
jgi:thymidylate synthase (FAD)